MRICAGECEGECAGEPVAALARGRPLVLLMAFLQAPHATPKGRYIGMFERYCRNTICMKSLDGPCDPLPC